VKKTIAIIGAEAETGAAIADKLSENSYHLLLVSDEIDDKSQTVQNIKQNYLNAEVEIVDCAREGCWEADIIVLAIPYYEIKEVVEKINEVVTQKIVVIISDEKESSFSLKKTQELQRLLPYSTIVTALYSPYSLELFMISDNRMKSCILTAQTQVLFNTK
jgi:predicted dinucleotide-binding enzyme